MYLKVGGFTHALNEVGLSISKSVERVNGVTRSVFERWTISGMTFGDNGAAVSAAMQAVLNAYVDGVDFTLLFDDLSETIHKLRSANCVGGTRIIVPPEFPVGIGAEYTTFRTWDAVVEAEVLDPNTALVSFEEVLTFQGGGPLYVFQPVLNGPPPKQLAVQQTTYKATQSGQAVGLLGYPPTPGPLWPADEHLWARLISRGSPKRTGSGALATYTDFPVSWSYSFEASNPFTGVPTNWPA